MKKSLYICINKKANDIIYNKKQNKMKAETIKKLVKFNNKNNFKVLGEKANTKKMKKALEEGLDPFEFISEEDL